MSISTDTRLAGHPLAVSLAELKTVLGALHTALDLAMDEPWQSDDAISH